MSASSRANALRVLRESHHDKVLEAYDYSRRLFDDLEGDTKDDWSNVVSSSVNSELNSTRSRESAENGDGWIVTVNIVTTTKTVLKLHVPDRNRQRKRENHQYGRVGDNLREKLNSKNRRSTSSNHPNSQNDYHHHQNLDEGGTPAGQLETPPLAAPKQSVSIQVQSEEIRSDSPNPEADVTKNDRDSNTTQRNKNKIGKKKRLTANTNVVDAAEAIKPQNEQSIVDERVALKRPESLPPLVAIRAPPIQNPSTLDKNLPPATVPSDHQHEETSQQSPAIVNTTGHVFDPALVEDLLPAVESTSTTNDDPSRRNWKQKYPARRGRSYGLGR